MQSRQILTLVINLDRSPQRLAAISEQLSSIGIPWERLPAAEGKLFALDDPSLVDLVEFGRRHGKSPVHGELGCFLSHVWSMQRFLETNSEFALILEDDVHLSVDLPKVLDALTDQSEDWDMVKLSGVHSGTPLNLSELVQHYHLKVMLTPYTGSSAYLVNRKAAKTYLDGLLPMRVPFDHEFDRGWHWNLKVRAVMPSPCGHDQDGVSLINTSAVNRKFHWSKRFPAMGWRLQNQWRRALYAWFAWFRNSF
jgi:glycosyl transferase, family 25